MKNKFLLAILLIFLSVNNVVLAETTKLQAEKTNCEFNFDDLNFTEKQANKEDFQKILTIIKNHEELANKHNLKELKKLYAPTYTSWDGFDKATTFELVKKNWQNFPDLKSASKIETVHINNNFATVQLIQVLNGTTDKPSDITGDVGQLTSNIRIIVYLTKFGNCWKITSDNVLYEKSFIKYGKAKSIAVDFAVPEQVKNNEEYTASAYIDLPSNMVALGSISKENIVYPEKPAEEIFRQIPIDSGTLERVLKANNDNKNELAVASVGFTEISKDIYQKAKVSLSGMVIMLQRINVITKTQEGLKVK